LYPQDFDPETFNNILVRAITRPNFDGNKELKKMVFVILILLILVVFGVLFTYLKASEILKIVKLLNVGGVI
jgi:hypothetical protein